MKRVLRYTVGVSDEAYEVPRGVPVLFGRSRSHSAPGFEGLLDIWFEITVLGHDWNPVEYNPPKQWVRVVGTAHPIPDEWRWLASFNDDGRVWHLYGVPDAHVAP